MGHGTGTRELKIGIAGAGTMARHHLRALATLEGARVVGIADPSSDARSRALDEGPPSAEGPEGFEDLQTLLAETRPDIVHVCTPMELHGEMAILALEGGAHVYVEKPVTPRLAELEGVLGAARSRELLVCGGHQVLFESPYRRVVESLDAIGTLVHVESHFAFNPVRTAGGGRPLTAAQQLIDVLPHPTYLLLDLLERVDPEGEQSLAHLELSGDGTLHGLVRRGGAVGTLVATLEGRPVEHWLRVTGTNGTLHADFVRGTVQRLLGPGKSGIDKALNPFRLSGQLAFGTTGALVRRVARRGGSYPGLAEIFGAFHRAIREGRDSPTSPDQLRGTVSICEAAADRIQARDEAEAAALEGRAPPLRRPDVLVTGGTGLLGREVVRSLGAMGRSVRVLSRRVPPARQRLPGVDYRAADLGAPLPDDVLDGIRFVVHCAAETAGGWDAHRRNSIEATERLVRASASAGVETFVHVSSVAVLQPREPGAPVRDDDPLHPDPERLGPYTWGKAESERVATEVAAAEGLRLKVVRPVPLLDPERFAPPGRLGRRVGNVYVAVGRPGERLVVADAASSGRATARVAVDPDAAPDAINLVPAEPPTRGALVEALRRAQPEVRVVWLPRLLLHPLSWGALAAQKVLRPRRPAIRLAPAFAAQRYEPGPAVELMSRGVEGARERAAVEAGEPAV